MGDLPGSFPGQSTMLKVDWDVTNGIRADLSQYGVVRGRTKRKLVGICIFFSVAHFIRTPQLSVLNLEQFGMGDLPGNFPGQSTMLKVVWDVTNVPLARRGPLLAMASSGVIPKNPFLNYSRHSKTSKVQLKGQNYEIMMPLWSHSLSE
ncbi:hypothetical protein MTR_0333s0010 [Medicago truncatula]|uniref:Uncharacterized protein n=1 Tax=Medicago truncatula TaxID=3880 RepID=A0A072TR92_MEDTR|nr:hypothetical protein MTR_0333s0010 [Medicago truncatula]